MLAFHFNWHGVDETVPSLPIHLPESHSVTVLHIRNFNSSLNKPVHALLYIHLAFIA